MLLTCLPNKGSLKTSERCSKKYADVIVADSKPFSHLFLPPLAGKG